MISYQSEIRAARARLAEIEAKLSETLGTIQSEASDRIVKATMEAVSEMQPLRIFLQSMDGSRPTIPEPRDDIAGEPVEVPSKRPKPSVRGAQKAVKTSKPRSGNTSGKLALLTILGASAEPMSSKDVDEAMLAAGQSADTARKERYLRYKEGLVTRHADQRLSLSDSGKEMLRENVGTDSSAG